MLARFRPRLTFANVVSMIALFVALGGTAWAVAANSVGTTQLKDNAVTTPKIKDGAVTNRKLGNGVVGPSKIGSIPAARAWNTAQETVPANTETTLTFDTNKFDTRRLHSTSTNISRLTAPTSGVYNVSVGVTWSANGTGRRSVGIRNGGDPIFSAGSQVPAVTDPGNVTTQSVSTQLRLSAGGYVEAVVSQTSGGDLSVRSVNPLSPAFEMSWVAP